MAGNMMAGSRIVDWMRSGCAISRGDALRATQMQWRLARYPGTETEPTAAVMASILRHRAQRVALCMIAGSAAWAPGRAGSWNDNDAHGFYPRRFFCGKSEFPNLAPTVHIRASNYL